MWEDVSLLGYRQRDNTEENSKRWLLPDVLNYEYFYRTNEHFSHRFLFCGDTAPINNNTNARSTPPTQLRRDKGVSSSRVGRCKLGIR